MNRSELVPINGYIVIKPVEIEEQTYGNIVIPDLGGERPEVGEVTAISDTYNYHSDRFLKALVQVGDVVLIPKMGSVRVTVGGEDYFICKESDIYSKVV